MNNQRRAEIRKILNTLSELQESVDQIAAEELDALENLPESIQNSEQGEDMQESVYMLQTAAEACESMAEALEGAAA